MAEIVKAKRLREAEVKSPGGVEELSLTDQLLQAAAERRRMVIEWQPKSGPAIKILVIEPTLEVRDYWLDLIDAESTGEDKDGKPTAKANGSVAKANVYLCVACAHNPETEQPLFNVNQQLDLIKLPTQSFVEPVAKAVHTLMKAAGTAGNASSKTKTDSSGSVLPPGLATQSKN